MKKIDRKEIIKIIARIQHFFMIMKNNQMDIYAGAAAFFLFVSFIPFIMLLIAIIPYTPVTDEYLLISIKTFLPNRLDSIADGLIVQLTETSIAKLSISAIGAIWLAAWGVQSIKKGLNKIYGINTKKNFLTIRLNAALYTVIFLISIIAIFIINIFSTRIFKLIADSLADNRLHSVSSLLSRIFNVRFLIIIILTFIICLYSFWVLPDKSLKIRYQIPGALFVSVVWYGFSKLFNLYVDKFNAYSMYGSLSFLIIVLMWLYTSMYIFFIGAQINYYLSETVKKDKI